jgi:hypothetical protein
LGWRSIWFPGGEGKKAPSVRKLVENAEFRRKYLAGEYVKIGRVWRCGECGVDHGPLDYVGFGYGYRARARARTWGSVYRGVCRR